MSIKPVVGMSVWYYPYGMNLSKTSRPNAAIITCVNSDDSVNLSYAHDNGHWMTAPLVKFVDDTTSESDREPFCTIPPSERERYEKHQQLTEAHKAARKGAGLDE